CARGVVADYFDYW
nr:immunoglobulin heavy chain junction region [Mus musculus]MBK4185305.1 immunoglobulin heavy chain junction region [Mus musculus]MBK4185308.1 immunoglobulin heavy chain junction region [Mus musculus]